MIYIYIYLYSGHIIIFTKYIIYTYSLRFILLTYIYILFSNHGLVTNQYIYTHIPNILSYWISIDFIYVIVLNNTIQFHHIYNIWKDPRIHFQRPQINCKTFIDNCRFYGKLIQKDGFSIAMFDYRRVLGIC
jgi:hypothetical protein